MSTPEDELLRDMPRAEQRQVLTTIEGLPFAELAYQRALAGRAPDGSEDEGKD